MFFDFFWQKESFPVMYNILYNAYLYKYDDFTVLTIDKKNQMNIYYYNYSSQIIEKKYVNESFMIFPDQIRKLKGYQLRIGVDYGRWYYYQNADRRLPIHLQPLLILYKSYQYFADQVNGTSIFIPLKNDKTIGFHIYNNSLDLFLTSSYAVGLWNYNNIYILREEKLMVEVPIIHELRIGVSIKIFYAFLAFVTVIIITIAAAKYLKLPKEEWTV